MTPPHPASPVRALCCRARADALELVPTWRSGAEHSIDATALLHVALRDLGMTQLRALAEAVYRRTLAEAARVHRALVLRAAVASVLWVERGRGPLAAHPGTADIFIGREWADAATEIGVSPDDAAVCATFARMFSSAVSRRVSTAHTRALQPRQDPF